MPAAWLIGYLQQKTGDTAGQKWVMTTGLFIAAVGFGKSGPIRLESLF